MSIKTAIDSISNHIEDIYDTLELGGEDLTNKDKNINNIYTNIKNRYKDYLANGTDMIWDNWESKSIQEGETLNFNNTIEAKIKTELKGNIYQATYTGKNLIPFTNQYFTKNGITYYVQNGSLYLNGTSYGETSGADQIFKDNFSFTLPAGTYTISHKTGITSFYLRIYSPDSNYHTLATNDSYWSFTITEETKFNIGFYVYNKSYNNINTQIMIEQNSSKTNYEPYVEKKASPTPENPQNIHVITGDNTIKIIKKNLFNITYELENQFKNNGDSTTAYTLDNGEIKCSVNVTNTGNRYLNKNKLDAGTYTVSGIARFSGTRSKIIYSVRYIGEIQYNILNSQEVLLDNTGIFSFNFTLTENTNNVCLAMQPVSNTDGTIYLSNLQLEKNDVATTYEPYQEQSQLISLGNIELVKVESNAQPTHIDRIYKNNEKWYLEKNVNKNIIDGVNVTGGYNSNYGYFYVPASDHGKYIHTHINNYFPKTSNGGINTYIYSGNDSNRLWLTDYENLWNSSSTNFNTWLTTHNLIIYFSIQTPIITEITDATLIEQLNNLEKLKSYNNQTNILQSENTDLPFIINATVLQQLT